MDINNNDYHHAFHPAYINSDAKLYIKNNISNWSNYVITEYYDGPLVQILFDFNLKKWIPVSEHSLHADDVYMKNKTICEILIDTNKLEDSILETLDKNLCYTLTILHNKYKNIVHYNDINKNYLELVLFQINTRSNPCIILPLSEHDKYNFMKMKKYNFTSYDEFNDFIIKLSDDDTNNRRISCEGFIIWDFKNNFFMKIQSDIFIKINKIKSLYKNNYKLYLSLYQKDKLADILPFFTKYTNEIINRINISMKTVSKEFLEIYHATRQKNNKELYNSLSDNYKKVLFSIHGLYIEKRKNEFENNKNSNSNSNSNINRSLYDSESMTIADLESKSITVHDIYHYLKSMQHIQLYQIYVDRMAMLHIPLYKQYLKINCIYTLTQTQLMINEN